MADRGVGGRDVVIRLRVRRFFCGNPDCPRRIFAEQVDGLTEPYRRSSPALRAMHADIGLALGGRAGERMACRLDAKRSRTTLLSLVRALPDPAPGPLRVVGVDEFCRDRAGPFADGARRGAPQAVQVADRWHLLKNLAEVLERVVKRNRAALVETPPDGDGDSNIAAAPIEGPLAERTRQRHAEVRELAARGVGTPRSARGWAST